MRNQLWSVPPFRKMPDRRIRKARFKDRDLRVLIDSVMERRGDIFGEGGQPPTMQSRRQAWLFVMEKVNAVSGTRRTWEEVRKKVHDLKKSTKEKLAYNRRARQLSCGGRPDIKTLTEFENDMILLFGKESFEGLDTVDLGVMSRLSECEPMYSYSAILYLFTDQGETSGSSTTAAKQHLTPKYQISSPQAEAGTSIDTPTGGGNSVEDEEELGESLNISEDRGPILVDDERSSFEGWRPHMLGPPIEADADTDLSGPAFKRRLLEHEFSVEQSLASIHTTVEDGMVMLDQRLCALQSAIEHVATPVASAVETSLTQALDTVGSSLMNAHSAAIEVLGSKLQEAVKAGFTSLGERLQATMAEGFQSLIEAQCSMLTQIIGQREKLASSTGIVHAHQVDSHSSGGLVPPKKKQVTAGAVSENLESRATQHQRPMGLMQVHQG
ncbi:uncharacterized protein [Chiloscyllium punctatum]|uniref:uncharacterized protein LOC122561275 isoform X1 n=1 Tax=Chiloscyllium plagiosum TaxID=36176 RepID=UPI001CB7C131|nr:uncharacterized protein LOC122561275 isoform X1 [Chiloscyllium plagiosum]